VRAGPSETISPYRLTVSPLFGPRTAA
jgi:hypothetical protein